jgi:hypothetical protein
MELESILIVYQNPVAGRQDAYDDWYTNIHIRDAMRLDGAIATQRFIVSDEQPVLDGKRVAPKHWAHTIYEWESAAKSVAGHASNACTPKMEISRDGSFEGLRDFFFRPVFMSHGWTQATGFRRGRSILTALIQPAGSAADFAEWFRARHAPHTLGLGGIDSAALFSLHEQQSLPYPCEYVFAAVYGLSDVPKALQSWAARHDSRSDADLRAHTAKFEIGCWQPRIQRLLATDVLRPPAEAAAQEQRARQAYKSSFMGAEELNRALGGTVTAGVRL